MRALTSYILQSDLTDGRSGVEVSVFQQIIVISTALVGSKKRTPALKRAMSLDHSKLRALSSFWGFIISLDSLRLSSPVSSHCSN